MRMPTANRDVQQISRFGFRLLEFTLFHLGLHGCTDVYLVHYI